MILPKLILPTLLLSAVSYTKGDGHDTHIRSVVNDDKDRELTHKEWKKLVADIVHTGDHVADIGGSIQLAFNDDATFDVSYHLHDTPGYCSTCYIAVIDADECSEDLDADGHHFDGRRRLYHDDEPAMEDPFADDKTEFISDENGDAIGGILGIDNGFAQHQNRCKVAVVWAEVEVEVKHSYKAKSSPKAHKLKRKLIRSDEKNTRRKLHTVTENVMKVVGCGVLKKKGDHDDCDH